MHCASCMLVFKMAVANWHFVFFGFFPKKGSEHESQKSGFRFDLKSSLEVWILWIHDPFFGF